MLGQEYGWHHGICTWNYEQDSRMVCFHKNSMKSYVMVVSWNFHPEGSFTAKTCYTVSILQKEEFQGVLQVLVVFLFFLVFGCFFYSQGCNLFHLNIGKTYQKFYDNFVSICFVYKVLTEQVFALKTKRFSKWFQSLKWKSILIHVPLT